MPDIVRGAGQAETRSFSSVMEVRSEGRTIYGIAVPFDQPTQVRDMAGPYMEVFRYGAFARTIAERGPSKVKVLGLHDSQVMPLGRAVSLVETEGVGLIPELQISKTRAGDEALELVRDGALDSMSVGFSPVSHRTAKDGTVERTEVKLHEISLVPFPAYDGARIAGIRSADLQQMASLCRSDLDLSATARAALAEVLDVFARAGGGDPTVEVVGEILGDDDEATRAAGHLALLKARHEHDAQRLRFTA
jgi:HK97 family phage prohead protease